MFPSPMDDPRLALTLTFTTFSSKLVDGLIEKLRKVTYFKLSYRKFSTVLPPVFSNEDLETIPLIIHLLGHWARSLVTLKLRCAFTAQCKLNQQEITNVAAQMKQLFESVNKLSLLEHLTLDFDEHLQEVKSLDMPILGRLKEFFFATKSGLPNLIQSSLDRYAESNDQLRSIGLGYLQSKSEFVDKFGQSPLAKRFSMLPPMTTLISLANLTEVERFVKTFTSLASFTVILGRLNLALMTATLAPLTRLIHLNLCDSSPDPLAQFSRHDDEPADQIRPLSSVKVLTVWMTNRIHNDTASRHWARMLPNLQILHLMHMTECCNFANAQSEPEKVTATCVQRTLLSFKEQCGRTLKKVYYCHNRDSENIQVFTPDTILDVYPRDDDE